MSPFRAGRRSRASGTRDAAAERELTIDGIPPDKFSAEIPADFLEPDTEVPIEVAAREKSGNRTSKEIFIDVVDRR